MKNVILVLVMTLLVAGTAMAASGLNVFPLPRGNVGIHRGVPYGNTAFDSFSPLTVSAGDYWYDYHKTNTTLGPRDVAFFGTAEYVYYEPFGMSILVNGAATEAARRIILQTGTVGWYDLHVPSGTLVLQPAGVLGIGSKFAAPPYPVPTEVVEVDGNVKADGFIGDGSGLTGLPLPDLSGIEQDIIDLQNAVDAINARLNRPGASGIAK